jgi:hypothetical protein
MRTIIQITSEQSVNQSYMQLAALCNDGSVWIRSTYPEDSWSRVEDIPQDEVKLTDDHFDR